MDSFMEALKIGIIAWGKLVLAMGVIFVVLMVIKKIGGKR